MENNIPNQQTPVNPEVNQPIQQPVRKKEKSSCGKIFACCFLFVFIITGTVFFLGYRFYKSLKQEVDLGVRYTQKDFYSFINKTGIALEGSPEDLCFACPVSYEGEQKADIKLTNEEASAWIEMLNKKLQVIEGMQVKFENGNINIATNFTYEGTKLPIFISASVEKIDEKSVSIDISQLKLGGAISLPVDQIGEINTEVNNFVNSKLEEMDGLSIESLDIGNGYASFKGTLPTKVSGMEDK
ncbi:hypothetical protein A2V49_03415 [candidate division WWE3 bacterium RBG_19FT_COMBO_34_6]|uniref:DUF2993 domain-containing protein n=1 Tax=candidate division WWE3 bacterium RBG_19FT_COMBO_34_6 TaxID=1802612 RepID=A0A1F4UKE8_UNCKA|nr:MAG: hypothetical protein A2V49_03415 [candidate division WWE3 bacterium RBG_19FT_COMBO_34_6]